MRDDISRTPPPIPVGQTPTEKVSGGDVGRVRAIRRHRGPRWSTCLGCQEKFKSLGNGGKKLCCPECVDDWRDAQLSALQEVGKAVREGRLPHYSTLQCVDCGAPSSAMEHRNYLKPLLVEPVCAKCNAARGPAAFPHVEDCGVNRMQVPRGKKAAQNQDYTTALVKRWADLSPEIADKSASGPVWLQLNGAAEPVKWVRPITMIEAKRIGARKWAAHYLTDSLTKRELQIFVGLGSGKTVTEIAKTSYLSIKTVSTYRSRIVEKTGLRTNVEIAIYAYRVGLVDWPKESQACGDVA